MVEQSFDRDELKAILAKGGRVTELRWISKGPNGIIHNFVGAITGYAKPNSEVAEYSRTFLRDDSERQLILEKENYEKNISLNT